MIDFQTLLMVFFFYFAVCIWQLGWKETLHVLKNAMRAVFLLVVFVVFLLFVHKGGK
jgi:hypothetical protein